MMVNRRPTKRKRVFTEAELDTDSEEEHDVEVSLVVDSKGYSTFSHHVHVERRVSMASSTPTSNGQKFPNNAESEQSPPGIPPQPTMLPPEEIKKRKQVRCSYI